MKTTEIKTAQKQFDNNLKLLFIYTIIPITIDILISLIYNYFIS
jgi:hypothetical protein